MAKSTKTAPEVEFNFFIVFETIRNCYAALISKDRKLYAPMVVSEIQKRTMENLLTDIPQLEITPFILLTDSWKAFGIEPVGLRLETHKSNHLIRGRIKLRQKNDLGTNLVDLECSYADLLMVGIILGLPIVASAASSQLISVQAKNPNAPMCALSEEVQRAMAILENANELKALIVLDKASGSPPENSPEL